MQAGRALAGELSSRAYGNLYLTDKQYGEDFDADGERAAALGGRAKIESVTGQGPR